MNAPPPSRPRLDHQPGNVPRRRPLEGRHGWRVWIEERQRTLAAVAGTIDLNVARETQLAFPVIDEAA